MKFALTTLYVQNMEKALFFYNEILGLPLISKLPIAEGKEIVFLGTEDFKLELIPCDDRVTYCGFSLGFEVKDLAAIKTKLSAHGYTIDREFSPNGQTVLCFFKGACGEPVELLYYHK